MKIMRLPHQTCLAIKTVLVGVNGIVVTCVLVFLDRTNNTESMCFTQLNSLFRCNVLAIKDSVIDVANQIIHYFKRINLDEAKQLPSTIIDNRIRLET
jgi:hypothetical protein